MPQLASAARYQGRCARFRKWAYQAKVMKMLDSTSSPAVRTKIEVGMVRYRMWQLARPCFSRYRWWYSSAR
jgi:hypothetical protein